MSYLLAAVAIAAAIGVAYRYPNRTKRIVRRLVYARRIVFGAFALLTALVLLGTGNAYFLLLGTAILVFAALIIYFQWIEGSGDFL